MGCERQIPGVTLPSLGLCWIVVFLLFGLTAVFMGVADDKEARAKSAEFVGALRSAFQSDAPFVLMLRSFKSRLVSEKIQRVTEVERDEMRSLHGELMQTGRKVKRPVYQTVYSDDVTEFFVSSALGSHVVIINSDPKELSSVPLTIVSDQWWRVLQELAAGACLIVIVPEPSNSLLEEIESMIAQHGQKTVFVMPPSKREGPEGELIGMARRERWQEIQAMTPVELPDYDESGALWMFTKPGSARVTRPYSGKTIEQLIRGHRKGGSSLATVSAKLSELGLLDPMEREIEGRVRPLMQSGLRRWKGN
jgi:hypothetical protein